jgi:bifunctional non-homologous end joining protein LigD
MTGSLPRYEPMLAVPWKDPFDDPAWSFEVKWDGFRALVESDEGGIRLRSRRGHDLSPSFPELAGLRVPEGCVVDGEIVVLDDAGRPDFAALQTRHGVTGSAARRRAASAPATVVAFDILHASGRPLIDLPLDQRRDVLSEVAVSPMQLSEPVIEHGIAFFDAVAGQGLEGVVAKRSGSLYRPGRRSPDWRKIAHRIRIRVIVGGYTPGEGGRSETFGALQLGLGDGGRLRYVGAVGTGFDDRSLRAIREALDGLARSESPFRDDPAIPRGTAFVEPMLVALVEAKSWTTAGRLRAPSFVGFTDDPADGVTWDGEGPGFEGSS